VEKENTDSGIYSWISKMESEK